MKASPRRRARTRHHDVNAPTTEHVGPLVDVGIGAPAHKRHISAWQLAEDARRLVDVERRRQGSDLGEVSACDRADAGDDLSFDRSEGHSVGGSCQSRSVSVVKVRGSPVKLGAPAETGGAVWSCARLKLMAPVLTLVRYAIASS